MATVPNILVVDDEPQVVNFLRTLLEIEAYEVETASNGLDAVRRVQEGPLPDLVLLDVVMPGFDGLETLGRLSEIRPGIKVVMLSGGSDPRTIVNAIRLGAQDYLPKPFQKADLESVIKRALGRTGPGLEENASMETAEQVGDDLYFLAACESMRKLRRQVGMIAGVDVPVLILGESGTGKEVLARLIHKLSPRADEKFLKVNCAALPDDLLESELFGFEAGAFTGATRPKPGRFELGEKGTILLDEIGEMSPALQAKLLQVLQDHQFSRLGGRSLVKVDVRILAATNVDIPQALASRKLREDLYYRLNTFSLTLPALRERQEEIPLLLQHFMARFAVRYTRDPLPLTPALVDAAIRHSWPGNLRELENFVKRYLILGDECQAVKELRAHRGNAIGARDSSPAPARTAHGDLKSIVRNLKDEAEIKAIGEALKHTNWNRKAASRLLNISYKALLYKIREYGLEDDYVRSLALAA
ncbi:MAG TPA: sigma-54 dependent transcriptional regulator [Terriglobia bacterium]|nr:sigma-54 dependent transcriptional regulator [Terriglobia bacterium]